MNDVCVCIFSKAPVDGKVKTRLLPALTEQQACLVHMNLLEHCLSNVKHVGWQCQLWTTDIYHPYIKQQSQQHAISVHLQQGEDLGARMRFAFKESLKKYSYVVLIGTDCPDLNSDYIFQAIKYLQAGKKVVLGPAKDGGYVLIAMSIEFDGVFENMDWGTDQVLNVTCKRLQQANIDWSELAMQRDIDRPGDLAFLKQSYPALFIL